MCILLNNMLFLMQIYNTNNIRFMIVPNFEYY